ncbi:MAG TPA: hypothetical protein VEV16_05100 [Daejeonella sp.]|nr:hypothetical protein [Daejeonella sp.]
MIRKVIKPQKQRVSLELTKDFLGKKVEIIAFTIEDTEDVLKVEESQWPYLLSEKSLAKDWSSPEEDQAWKDL